MQIVTHLLGVSRAVCLRAVVILTFIVAGFTATGAFAQRVNVEGKTGGFVTPLA